MALKLQAALNGNETVLQSESSNTYSGELSAPVLPVKYRNGAREYPLSVVAEDDAGNISRNNSTIISVVNLILSYQIQLETKYHIWTTWKWILMLAIQMILKRL